MASTPEQKVFDDLIQFFQSGKDQWQKEEIVRTVEAFRKELGWIGIQQASWKQLVDCWNACPKLSKIVSVSTTRQRNITARLREQFFRENYQEAIMRIVESPFLMGANDRGWTANVDWFVQPNTIEKIMEGRYATRTATQAFEVPAPKKPVNLFELERSVKLIETEIERLKGKKIYLKDTGAWLPDPAFAEELKKLYLKRRELITKRIDAA